MQRLLSFVLVIFLSGASHADMAYENVKLTVSDDHRLMLNASMKITLSPAVIEALENGVPVTFEKHIQVREQGAWVWTKDIAEYRMRSVLRYRLLEKVYELKRLDSGSVTKRATLAAALTQLGEIQSMPLIEVTKLSKSEAYNVELDAKLDIEALPLPLRPKAYISSDWSLSAETVKQGFKP